VQRTLGHILWGDRIWMSRFAGWPKPEGGIKESGSIFAEWEALKPARIETDTGIEAWAASVDPAWLAGNLSWYSGAAGREMTKPTWTLVAHMFNHQTHHRGQAHALLTSFGLRTGDTDLPFIVDFAALGLG
jgi:uncharacterized damage-inducible protein DinB